MARERGLFTYSVPPLGQENQLSRRFPTWPVSDGPGFRTQVGEPQSRGESRGSLRVHSTQVTWGRRRIFSRVPEGLEEARAASARPQAAQAHSQTPMNKAGQPEPEPSGR